MKRIIAALTAALLVVPLVSSVALAAPNNQWDVWNINAAGTMYKAKPAPGNATSVANFAFPSTATTALLTTTQDKSVLGNLAGKTITATFTITASGATFIYGGEPDGSGAGPTVRLYFNTKGKFTNDTAGYSLYWWSNPLHYDLAGGPFTLTVPVDSSNWSNWGGQLASATGVTDYFNAAAADVTEIGLSFGGGYFFANGVGVSPGSASFTLTSFAVK